MKLFFREGLFSYKSYRIAFIGQSISFIGSWIHFIGQSWLAYQLTHSPIGLGMVGFGSTILLFFFSFLSGMTADRFPKLKILILSQFSNCCLSFFLGLLSYLKMINFYELLLLSFAMGIFNNLELPSRQTLLLSYLPNNEIKRAIAMNAFLFNSARLIGPAVAGIILPLYGPSICFFINGISYILSIGSFIWASSTNERIKDQPSGRSTKNNFFVLISNPAVFYPSIVLGIVTLFGWSYSVLLPYISSQIYHQGSKGLALFYSANGFGAISAALLISFFPNRFSSSTLQTLSMIIFSFSLFLFSFFPPFFFSILIVSFLGFSLALFVSATTMFLQERISDSMRGMAFGLTTFFFQGFFAIGNLLMGTLAQFLGTKLSLMIGSVICFTAFFSLRIRSE
ncbi:MFS transporter [Candidatus Methylacidiphilum fumarolicum]|uniref:MFS transporter n=1 Tax=Candidatus Methylacidiphilum fumarolicum TaxID=591154 RepID=UPI00106A788B|nr:MFS transporter [Candidatus Methylacidiphilum fumarolicum]TFE73008.1 MFS transporter [Candidatus Methylacidiphilum fumarolicum]